MDKKAQKTSKDIIYNLSNNIQIKKNEFIFYE